MKITVNDKPIRIFVGATVKDALRRYFAKTDPAKAEDNAKQKTKYFVFIVEAHPNFAA